MGFEYLIERDPIDFGLELCVSSGQVFRWSKDSSGVWRGVDGPNWYLVQEEEKCLRIVSNSGPEAFRSLFRLDWSGPNVRSEIIALGPELQTYIDQLPGLRLMRPASEHEAFFCFMCTPNNHLNRITAMIRTLSEYGEPFPDRPEISEFPSIERISFIPEEELRAKGFGYRGATIPKAAAQILELGGSNYLKGLKELNYSDAHQALTSIHGIGPKLADCIALFGLDHTDAVPIDTHIWQAATRVYFPEWQGTSLTAAKYIEIGRMMRERFGPLAGWAHQYLFFENLLNWRSRRSAGDMGRVAGGREE